jgi:hypothetical protein
VEPLVAPTVTAPEKKPVLTDKKQSVPTGWVKIVNRGTSISLRSELGPFRIERAGDYYKIRCQESGNYLALAEWATKEEYAAEPPQGRHQWFLRKVLDSNSPLMLWEIESRGNGFWSITNRASGKCLEIRNKERAWQSSLRDGDLEQQWQFEKADSP